MTEESNADAGRDGTSRETLGEDPVTGLNDLKLLMRDTLREILPEFLGERGGGDGNTNDPHHRPDKIHPKGERATRAAWVCSMK